MLRSIAAKTLRDLRRGFVMWSAGLVGLVAMMQSVYPSIRHNEQINQLLKSYPDAMKGLIAFGGPLDYTSAPGYLGAELFSFMVPLLLIVATVGAGSRAIAGEEDRGTLDLLLALPVRRERVLLEKALALVVEVVALGCVLWLSLWVGAVVIDMHISGPHLAAGTASATLLAMVFGSLALLIGAVAGHRGAGLAIGLTSAVAVSTYLLNALAPLATVLSGPQKLSPFYYYASSDPLRRGLDAGNAAVLAGVTVLMIAIAVLAIRRRDLAV
ncbi:MAG TPA: ABC transporter permease subunit [Gaiellales bacterium]|nr:ABC transporter permease subunit [Gaiellales bacterium]